MNEFENSELQEKPEFPAIVMWTFALLAVIALSICISNGFFDKKIFVEETIIDLTKEEE